MKIPKVMIGIFALLIAAGLLSLEASAAIYRTISAGLEGNLSGLTAAVADHIIHLTIAGAGSAVLGATLRAAGGAAAGLVLETLVSIELLLGSGEYEFVAALTAGQSLVFEHGNIPS